MEKDHPQHGTEILGGMWGYKRSTNIPNSDRIFEKILDQKISKLFNKNLQSEKGADQSFLSNHVYSLLVDDSVIHDAYTCKSYNNSRPFPTRRVGYCFVGTIMNRLEACSNATAEKLKYYTCPEQCRPSNHLDWTSC